jgi:membrane-associated protein
MDNPLHQIQQIIEWYGIYAVFVLCMVEGDITLLLSGAMATSHFFGDYSFFKVLGAGIFGGVAGDSIGYWIGRVFAKTIKNYKFYQRAQPRIERLVENFGGYALVISKYIYGIRAAMCISTGVGKMPYWRFFYNDLLSCTIWALILSTVGYFFGSAITGIIGDFQQIGFVLLAVLIVGVVGFYLLERFWLSKKVESANPETIHELEEKLHAVSENIQEKLHLSQHSMPKPDLSDIKSDTKIEKQEAKAAQAPKSSQSEKD